MVLAEDLLFVTTVHLGARTAKSCLFMKASSRGRWLIMQRLGSDVFKEQDLGSAIMSFLYLRKSR